MSLNAALSLFLEEYSAARNEEFAGHVIGEFVRKEIPQRLEKILGNDQRYTFKGSVGSGQWAAVPWVAIFNQYITTSAQKGYYLVYLTKEDFSGIYLSLNQGVTTVKEQYGSNSRRALEIRASDFLARIGKLNKRYLLGPIDLAATSNSTLSPDYQSGAVCSIYYARNEIPDDDVLERDLHDLVNIYEKLYFSQDDGFEPPETVTEDFRLYKEHRRIERKSSNSDKVKKAQGYVCKACGFDFKEKYGQLGHEYIEAHHLIPVSDLAGKLVDLDIYKDFTVLCSNCHRMIHRSEYSSNLDLFIKKYIKNG